MNEWCPTVAGCSATQCGGTSSSDLRVSVYHDLLVRFAITVIGMESPYKLVHVLEVREVQRNVREGAALFPVPMSLFYTT